MADTSSLSLEMRHALHKVQGRNKYPNVKVQQIRLESLYSEQMGIGIVTVCLECGLLLNCECAHIFENYHDAVYRCHAADSKFHCKVCNAEVRQEDRDWDERLTIEAFEGSVRRRIIALNDLKERKNSTTFNEHKAHGENGKSNGRS